MEKLKLGVIFGGMSTENEVSCVSGISIIKNLNKEKYDIYPIYISKTGEWFEVHNIEKHEKIGDELEDRMPISNVMEFINIINDPKGINIGIRHITISTCGIVPKIRKFMQERAGVNLAISLHASDDETRDKIMPINKVHNISEIIKVVKEYIKKTNRRVTFEYILLKDINDKKKDALNLVKLLKGINCYVNLIPYNETSNIIFKKSDKNSITTFYEILKENNIEVTIRREFGSKVSAACGQLRSNQMERK